MLYITKNTTEFKVPKSLSLVYSAEYIIISNLITKEEYTLNILSSDADSYTVNLNDLGEVISDGQYNYTIWGKEVAESQNIVIGSGLLQMGDYTNQQETYNTNIDIIQYEG